MFKGRQGVLIVTCAFLSTLIHVTAGQEYCGWVTTDLNRKVESKEKTILAKKRTKQYCVSNNDLAKIPKSAQDDPESLRAESTDSTQIHCKARFHHNSFYLRKECYCVRIHECKLESFNCSKCLDYQDVVCMNKGRIGSTSLELCKEEHLLECECPEGFSGKLCEDVLERRKCRITLPSEDLQGLEECGQGDSNEANCRLQYKDNRPYKCFEAANDLESVEKIRRLPRCSQDFLHNKPEPGGWSPWVQCDYLPSLNQACLCRSKQRDPQTDPTYKDLTIQVTNCTVHGSWTAWSEWSGCSVTCGPTGNQTRSRQCDNPTPKHGGNHCQGSGMDIKPCRGKRRCPVHYSRSSWSDWQPMESLNITHEKLVKSRFMCKSGIPKEKMASACYVKSRVKYCDRETEKCQSATLKSLAGKYFPIDWMVGKYCSIHRKFLGKYCKCHRLGITFACSHCAKSPLNSKHCMCIGSCGQQNVYIKDEK